jgi:hypothetical protein
VYILDTHFTINNTLKLLSSIQASLSASVFFVLLTVQDHPQHSKKSPTDSTGHLVKGGLLLEHQVEHQVESQLLFKILPN